MIYNVEKPHKNRNGCSPSTVTGQARVSQRVNLSPTCLSFSTEVSVFSSSSRSRRRLQHSASSRWRWEASWAAAPSSCSRRSSSPTTCTSSWTQRCSAWWRLSCSCSGEDETDRGHRWVSCCMSASGDALQRVTTGKEQQKRLKV